MKKKFCSLCDREIGHYCRCGLCGISQLCGNCLRTHDCIDDPDNQDEEPVVAVDFSNLTEDDPDIAFSYTDEFESDDDQDGDGGAESEPDL